MRSYPISITKAERSRILAALPRGVDRRRKALLPRILDEWVHVDLPEHFDWEARRRQAKMLKKRLSLVQKRATQLVASLQELESEDHFFLAMSLTTRKTKKGILDLNADQISKSLAEFKHVAEWLVELAAGANDANRSMALGRGRPRAIFSYLVMLDLVAIFEYLTHQRATRSVRGEDHFEYGAEYGPFWNFAEARWTAIFKSALGLKSTIRNWVEARNRYGEVSPLIANMDLRHPQWGIFGK